MLATAGEAGVMRYSASDRYLSLVSRQVPGELPASSRKLRSKRWSEERHTGDYRENADFLFSV
jgi:hypothetical protein